MRLHFHKCVLSMTVAMAIAFGMGEAANAAWVTFKNETSQTIVIVETVVINGQPRRGKPTSLAPGETIREFIPGATTKKIEVLDVKNRSMWSGNLNCKDETQTFSFSIANGKITVEPSAPPNPKMPKK